MYRHPFSVSEHVSNTNLSLISLFTRRIDVQRILKAKSERLLFERFKSKFDKFEKCLKKTAPEVRPF